MKIIPLAGVILSALTASTALLALRQQERLTVFRHSNETGDVPAEQKIEQSMLPTPSPTMAALTPAEHEELLKLRGQVRPLLDQLAERKSDTNRLARLRDQIEAIQKIKAPRGPGYIPRSDARNLGNGSAEASIETFLWAIQHRDTNVLFSVLSSAMREAMGQRLAEQGTEKFFKEEFQLGGLRILAAHQLDAETMELTFEPLPGESEKVKFRRENNGWVMAP